MPESTNDLELRRKQLKSQMSTVQTRRQQAVCVRQAYKRYGSKSNPYVILDGLNMTVPKGAIYGLLGASGCGKTTLLNCIVGRKRLNSGEIWVLGGTPGSKGSGVPGPRVGYMPQEIALYGEFTIRETLHYFGWIADMTTTEVDKRVDFFVNFLLLPDANRTVKTLSGGQQRRVSLAATLLHEPELLILDEPTAGVDPILRQNIWNHLVEITKTGRTTVIITTHYIDETRQAHLIGLMRGGYLLAEESPTNLIAQFQTDNLEDVFLKLSVLQNMGGKKRRASIAAQVSESIQIPAGAVNEGAVLDDEICEISGEFGDNISMSSRGGRVSTAPEPTEVVLEESPEDEPTSRSCIDYFKFFKFTHMHALIWKNFLWMWRNPAVMAFIIGLPIVQTILFCWSIGHDPKHLTLSIVNHELEESEVCKFTPGCNSTRLSCNYLNFLEKRDLHLTYQPTVEKSNSLVRHGEAWATLAFASNFSDSIRARIEGGRNVYDWDLETSSVSVWQDKSNENIGSFVQRDLYAAFLVFFQDYLTSCNIDPKIGSLPIRFEKPVYGYGSPDFTDFAAPGIIITIIFFLAVALTSGAMLIERNEGILERSLVNGISGVEILFSHVITQFTVMAGQSIMVLIFSFAVFGLTQNGSLLFVSLLLLLNGLCGMCFGFVVSCSCDTERTATYMALGSFLPIVMVCGIVWPIESMHYTLKFASIFLPLTKSTESMRAMMARGWGIANPIVYNGFLATFVWIIVFLGISILVLKFKKG